MVFRAELENEAQTCPNMAKKQIFIKNLIKKKKSIFYKNRFFYRGGGIGRRPFKYAKHMFWTTRSLQAVLE